MKRALNKLKDNAIGSGKVSTILGNTLGVAIAGATKYFVASGGNISSWQGYALAAGVAVAGSLLPGKKKKD